MAINQEHATPPRTPYEVRIRTWLWIRKQLANDYLVTIAELWKHDAAFREASEAMEQLDSAKHAAMPQPEKVAAMMRHGRVMCARVRHYKEQQHGADGL